MTTLCRIRNLEVRLHSHVLEWNDHLLMNELMNLLDDLQCLHTDLDRCHIPSTDHTGMALTLKQRLAYLVRTRKSNSSASL